MGFVAIPDVTENLDCYFYHSMDFPDGSSVAGDWDLRGRFDDYTANVEVRNKVVLDVGTASGFWHLRLKQRALVLYLSICQLMETGTELANKFLFKGVENRVCTLVARRVRV